MIFNQKQINTSQIGLALIFNLFALAGFSQSYIHDAGGKPVKV
ncbi:hypothetical protein [Marinifilum sp.]